MSLLIKDGWILTQDSERRVIAGGYVLIRGETIAEVGPAGRRAAELERQAGEVIDAAGRLVLPGLINAHSHLYQTFTRGLADDKSLDDWLKLGMWPFCLAMTEEDFYLAALLGCLENLKNGATSVIDQFYVHTRPENSDAVFKAMADSGIRGTLCRCYADDGYHPAMQEEKGEALAEIERLYRAWHRSAGGRLTLSVGPLNPWAVSMPMFQESYALARQLGLNYQVHTAETRFVVEATLKKFGKRNVELFHHLGLLGSTTQLVHSVWLDEAEQGMVAESGALVVHCPVANMYLASGVAPIPALFKRGVPVALATDGPGSNNSQGMLEVLKFTACLHKVATLDPTVLLPAGVLDMAWAGGSRALGRADVGQLAPGCRADIIIVDWLKPHAAPVHDPYSALVYNLNGNDVATVLVDGRVLVRDGRATFVDESELLARCQERARAIKAAI